MISLSPRIWAMLGTGLVILGLIAALLVTRDRLDDVKGERDMAEAKLMVSNASANSCADELDRVTAEQVELAGSDAVRIERSRQMIELAEAAADIRQAAIDRLRASASQVRDETPPGAACEASPTLLTEWPA